MALPGHLRSTKQLLTAAFGDQVPKDMVLPVLRVLYDHMSDRNVAAVMADINGGTSAFWLNEVYKAATLDLRDPSVESARLALEPHGLAAWLAEP